MFTGFAFTGYFLNGLVPAAGSLPYLVTCITSSIHLPHTVDYHYTLTPKHLAAGASSGSTRPEQGAALAFLITGRGTSFGAMAGYAPIARWRVISLSSGRYG